MICFNLVFFFVFVIEFYIILLGHHDNTTQEGTINHTKEVAVSTGLKTCHATKVKKIVRNSSYITELLAFIHTRQPTSPIEHPIDLAYLHKLGTGTKEITRQIDSLEQLSTTRSQHPNT